MRFLGKKYFLVCVRTLLVFFLPFLVSIYLYSPFTKTDLGSFGSSPFSLSDAQITGTDQHPLKLLIADILQVPLHIRFYEIHIKLDFIPKPVIYENPTSTAAFSVLSSDEELEFDCNFKKLKERPEFVSGWGVSGKQNYEIIPGKDFCFLYGTDQGIAFNAFFGSNFSYNDTTFHAYAKQNLMLFFVKYIILFFILNGIWLLISNILKNLILARK